MLIDFLQSLFNLLLGLFVLRYVQMQLSADSTTGSALAFLLH
jgi:hypothetical protein